MKVSIMSFKNQIILIYFLISSKTLLASCLCCSFSPKEDQETPNSSTSSNHTNIVNNTKKTNTHKRIILEQTTPLSIKEIKKTMLDWIKNIEENANNPFLTIKETSHESH